MVHHAKVAYRLIGLERISILDIIPYQFSLWVLHKAFTTKYSFAVHNLLIMQWDFCHEIADYSLI